MTTYQIILINSSMRKLFASSAIFNGSECCVVNAIKFSKIIFIRSNCAICATVFFQHYILPSSSEKSESEEKLDEFLRMALSAKTVAEKAVKIKDSVDYFLQEELGTLKKGEFIQWPAVASLCKYHLFAANKIKEDPTNPGYFQLSESESSILKLT